MMVVIIYIALSLVVGIQQISANLPIQQTTIPPVVTYGNGMRSCPSSQQRENAFQTIRQNVVNALGLDINDPSFQCGTGQWTRIAYLDMTDPFQRCPSTWRENITNGVRVCGRPSTSNNMCHGTFYSSGGQTYTKVCGRVIGYQVGHPDAFHSSTSIDAAYVEGVSITHGFPRSHIWTLAADLSETGNRACPCDNGSTSNPPFFVGNNYYCESGNQNSGSTNYFLYASDPLWDGQQCSSEGNCCSTAPWFSVNLFTPTRDSIEVRICSDFDTSEDTPIQLLELYIQ